MHIHLPKPVHGWREFLGEVGIIVLGILIALGTEQLIEAVHWRHKAEKALEDLRGAIGNTAELAAEQKVVGPCIDRQLELLAARLTAPGPYRPAILYTEADGMAYTVRAPSREWGDSVWQTANGEGVSTHLPAKKREGIDTIYHAIDEMRVRAQASEVIIWRLNSLAQPLALDPATRLRLLQDIDELHGRESLMTLIASQILETTREAGMMPSPARIRRNLDKSGTIAFCRSHRLPLGKVL